VVLKTEEERTAAAIDDLVEEVVLTLDSVAVTRIVREEVVTQIVRTLEVVRNRALARASGHFGRRPIMKTKRSDISYESVDDFLTRIGR
jgi:hypothetical protein